MFSDIKRLFKHTAIYSFGNIVMRTGAFVLLPLYTHYLTVAEYGILELLNSVSSIISSFLSIGLAHATLRFYFEYDEQKDRNAVISSSLITSLLLTIPSVWIISFFNPQISLLVFDSVEYVSSLNMVYIILVFEMARQIGLSYLRAKEYSILFVVVSFIQLIVQVGCNIVTVAYLHLGIYGILLGNMLSVFCGLLICLYVILKECGLQYDVAKMKAIFSYSFPFLFSSISSVVIQNADKFILKALLSMEAVGIYSLALKFGMLLKELMIEPFQRSFGAFRFSVMKQDNVKQIQVRTLIYLVSFVTWGGLLISLFNSEIIHFLSATEYYSVSQYVPLIVFASVIGSCGYVFQTGILFKKKTFLLFCIGLVSGVIRVVTAWFLINLFSIWGAAAALVLQSCVYITITNYFSQKIYEIKYQYVMTACIILISVVLFLLGYFSCSLIDNIIIVILVKLLISCSFPFVLLGIKCFTRDEIGLLRDSIKKLGGMRLPS